LNATEPRWHPEGDIPMTERWLSISDAATLAGVSRQAVHGWIARGHLTIVRSDDASGSWLDATRFTQFLAERAVAVTKGVRIETVRHWQVDGDPEAGS
jgi:hypothetical protein